MKPTDNGYYRPFNQEKRNCKKCKKYIEKVMHKSEQEYMRCKLSPTITVPYIEDGISCARYEEREQND